MNANLVAWFGFYGTATGTAMSWVESATLNNWKEGNNSPFFKRYGNKLSI